MDKEVIESVLLTAKLFNQGYKLFYKETGDIELALKLTSAWFEELMKSANGNNMTIFWDNNEK